MTVPEQKRMTSANWALLILISFLWGASFPANRVILQEIGFISAVAFRVGGAALALWLWIWLRRIPLGLTRRRMAALVLLGIGGNVVTFVLASWGQQHVASGVAGILNASAAIFAVLLGAMFYADERLTLGRSIGVALGIGGVILTIGAAALRNIDVLALGQISILAGNLTYAACTVFARRALRGMRPEAIAAITFSIGAVVVVPIALLIEGRPSFDYRLATWGSLVVVAFFTSAIAYILFYRVLDRIGVGNVSLATLLTGPWAVFLGTTLLGEVPSASALAGFALIALGLVVIDGRLFAPARQP